jgi:hypothetical protein
MPDVVVALAARSVPALAERLALLSGAVAPRVVVLRDRAGVAEVVAKARRGAPVYLLDVNRPTAEVALRLLAARRPYVLDTGDDAAALARGSGANAGVAAARGAADRLVVRGARAVVHRGFHHGPLLRSRTRAPLHFAPDTAPDDLLDSPPGPGDEGVVATFGSTGAPRAGDRVYGWEVVDVVAATPGLRGLVVGRGPGLDALRARALRLGVADRVTFCGPLPLPALVEAVGGAAFLTSVQSDDRAGWVRTTGKLPLALAARRVPVATRVGEAARVLPDRLLVPPAPDSALVAGAVDTVRAGTPEGWPQTAGALAETYRRSRVADGLRDFLATVLA